MYLIEAHCLMLMMQLYPYLPIIIWLLWHVLIGDVICYGEHDCILGSMCAYSETLQQLLCFWFSSCTRHWLSSLLVMESTVPTILSVNKGGNRWAGRNSVAALLYTACKWPFLRGHRVVIYTVHQCVYILCNEGQSGGKLLLLATKIRRSETLLTRALNVQWSSHLITLKRACIDFLSLGSCVKLTFCISEWGWHFLIHSNINQPHFMYTDWVNAHSSEMHIYVQCHVVYINAHWGEYQLISYCQVCA